LKHLSFLIFQITHRATANILQHQCVHTHSYEHKNATSGTNVMGSTTVNHMGICNF